MYELSINRFSGVVVFENLIEHNLKENGLKSNFINHMSNS